MHDMSVIWLRPHDDLISVTPFVSVVLIRSPAGGQTTDIPSDNVRINPYVVCHVRGTRNGMNAIFKTNRRQRLQQRRHHAIRPWTIPPTCSLSILWTQTTLRLSVFGLSRISITLHVAPPCCAVGRLISRRVRVTGETSSRRRVSNAGSRRSAKPGFLPISAGKASIIILSSIWGTVRVPFSFHFIYLFTRHHIKKYNWRISLMTRYVYINVGTTKRLKTLIKAAFQSSGLAIILFKDACKHINTFNRVG